MPEYHVPSAMRIERYKETERLYKLEEKLHTVFKECAKEVSKIHGYNTEEFWTHAVPQTMYDLLSSFDTHASVIVAETFLEREKARR